MVRRTKADAAGPLRREFLKLSAAIAAGAALAELDWLGTTRARAAVQDAGDSEYQYQIDLGDYKSPKYRFRTAPAPGTRAKSLKKDTAVETFLYDKPGKAPTRKSIASA
jgi:hypothetical protein